MVAHAIKQSRVYGKCFSLPETDANQHYCMLETNMKRKETCSRLEVGELQSSRLHSNLERHGPSVLDIFSFTLFDRVASHLLIIALECCKVFASLGEFTFLHTFTNIPMDESTLRVHEIEFVREGGPCLSDGGSIGEHAAKGQLVVRYLFFFA
jgi:hypothetical protein